MGTRGRPEDVPLVLDVNPAVVCGCYHHAARRTMLHIDSGDVSDEALHECPR